MTVTSFSGGAVISGSQVWTREPTPVQAFVPVEHPKFVLEVTIPDGPSMAAVSEDINLLLDFANQSYQLGYEFIRLERIVAEAREIQETPNDG